ncbi:hypothetical protein AB5N19_08503 [Seiridium cardinale]
MRVIALSAVEVAANSGPPALLLRTQVVDETETLGLLSAAASEAGEQASTWTLLPNHRHEVGHGYGAFGFSGKKKFAGWRVGFLQALWNPPTLAERAKRSEDAT